MKKIFSLFALLAGVMTFTSCGEDDATYSPTPALEISDANVLFEAEGGTGTITVKGSGTVSAAVESGNWLTVDVNGNTVTATAPLNSSLSGRSATIRVKSGSAEAVVTATQKGSVYGLAEGWDYEVADLDSSVVLVPIVHTEAVHVQSLTSWLTAVFNEETSNIEIVAQLNDAAEEREGLVAFQTGILKDTIAITQRGILLDIDPATISVSSDSTDQKVTIQHSQALSFGSRPDWVTLKGSDKNGVLSLTVTILENTGEARSGEIVVKSGQVEKTITINQDAPKQGEEPEPQEDENPVLGTFTFYWTGSNTYNLGDFTVEEYTGEDAEEGDVVLKDFYVPGNQIWGFYDVTDEGYKLYIYANQALGILTDPDEGDYGNLLQSTSGASAIEFVVTPDGLVSDDLRIMGTNPEYTEGWWWEIPGGGTATFVKVAAASSRSVAAVRGGFKAKSRAGLPAGFSVYKK